MAMDLFCYSTMTPAEVTRIMAGVEKQHGELFSWKFLVSPARDASEIGKETALEYNFHARSLFLIRYNDKSSLHLDREVIETVKQALGPANVLILFEGETVMWVPTEVTWP